MTSSPAVIDRAVSFNTLAGTRAVAETWGLVGFQVSSLSAIR